MKKLIVVITVLLLLLVGCTVVQSAADSIQRNFKLQQLEHGLSLRDSLMLK
nr:MAG TPA: foot protein [Caudoviricetes sp.]